MFYLFFTLGLPVNVRQCDQINSAQHGKMNIFTCSHPIPRSYQLSNGIFVPINIENGHAPFVQFFRLHRFVAHWHSNRLQ